MFQNKYIQKIWLTLLLATPIVLWLLPSNFFDGGNIAVLCPTRRVLGVECLGCGMTRAVMHLHHFEWSEAINFNRGVVWAYPILVVIWFVWVKKAINEIKS